MNGSIKGKSKEKENPGKPIPFCPGIPIRQSGDSVTREAAEQNSMKL
jgi:hypothetical protein